MILGYLLADEITRVFTLIAMISIELFMIIATIYVTIRTFKIVKYTIKNRTSDNRDKGMENNEKQKQKKKRRR